MKKALRIIGYSFGLFFFIIILLLSFTQTKLFKERLRSLLASAITTQTNSSLTLGTIRGNFLNGFTIDSLTLRTGSEPFLSTKKIAISYELFDFYRRTFTIHSLTIEQPVIRLMRGADSIWNFNKITQTSTETQTPSSPFAWKFRVERLLLTDGAFSLRDEVRLNDPEHSRGLSEQVEYHDIAIFSFSLELTAEYQRDSAHVTIKQLAFRSQHPSFILRKFSGEFGVGRSTATVRNMEIETDKSRLKLTASLGNFNPFEGIELEQLERKPVRLTLLADDINLNELKSFIAPIDFLNGSAYVDLETSGEFGNLSIDRLDLQTYSTTIKIKGTLQNLHKPNDLFMTVMMHDSRITPSDADRLLPPFHIPRFETAGVIEFSSEYVGKPLDFKARMIATGEVGSVKAEGRLNLQGKEMEYDGTFETQKLDLGRFQPQVNVQGRFTAKGEIHGSGTSLRTLASTAKVLLDSSVFGKISLTNSEIAVTVKNEHLNATLALLSPGVKTKIQANADFTHRDKAMFSGDASFSDVDLARILGDKRYSSSLNGKATIKGAGSTIEDAEGDISMALGPSTFGEHRFGNEEMSLHVAQIENGTKELSINSPVVDLHLHGKFSMVTLIDHLSSSVDATVHSIVDRLDATRTSPVGKASVRISENKTENSDNGNVDVEYDCSVKDLKSLSIFWGGTQFNGRGTVRGTMKTSGQKLFLNTTAAIEELFIGKIGQGTLMEGATLNLSTEHPLQINGTSSTSYLPNFSAKVDFFANHILLNKTSCDSTRMTLLFRDSQGSFEAQSLIDSTINTILAGNVEAGPYHYELNLETLLLGFGSVHWQNNKQARILLDTGGVHLSNFQMARNNENLTLDASVQRNGRLAAQLRAHGMDISQLGNYVGVSELTAQGQSFTGLVDIEAVINGTTDSPQLILSANGEKLTFRDQPIGRLVGKIDYLDKLLHLDIKLEERGKDTLVVPHLKLFGTIPINLALSGNDKRFPDQPMNLQIQANDLQLGILDPIIGSVHDLKGLLNCSVLVNGSPSSPLYGGNISISGVEFVFVPNNIRYHLSGQLHADRDKIKLSNVQITNDSRDRSDGMATLAGSMTIHDFAISDFDLTANGQLLILSSASRQNVQTMHGTLFTAAGSEGLHFSGTYDHSFLTGQIFINEASLVFPPKTSATYVTGGDVINYIVIDDTSKGSSQKKLLEQFYSGSNTENLDTSNGFAKFEHSIWDGLKYDLRIETQGNVEIRMIFTQATNEELFAQLEGRVNLQKSESGPRMIGEIAVSERSYYNFFKRFDASGTLKFVGAPDNPELKIKATYQGVRQPPEATSDSTSQNVVVILDITGTRYEPNLKMSMTVDGKDWATEAKGGDIQSDAISFILTGKFNSDLTSREKSDIVSNIGGAAGSSLLFGLPSQMLSGVLTDFLRTEFSFIRSAEVTYQGGSLQESADLRLSGEVFRAYWRFGGRIFNDIGNANVSFVVSMAEVFSAPSLRNLYLELERKVEGAEFIEQRKLSNAARLYYKFSF